LRESKGEGNESQDEREGWLRVDKGLVLSERIKANENQDEFEGWALGRIAERILRWTPTVGQNSSTRNNLRSKVMKTKTNVKAGIIAILIGLLSR
jgi:hypothetical protein